MVAYGHDLKNAHFKAVAELIIEVFPTELIEAYYVPPHAEGVQQSVSKGKLPYKYRNIKTSMKETGVSMISKSSKQVSLNDITIENLLPEQQFFALQVWLKSYIEPWTEVLERWTKTAPNRIHQFTKDRNLSINNILTEWPLFKHPLGYSLILSTLPSKISEDGKGIVVMYLLPTLLPPAIIREKGKGSWEPTIAEAQETFALYTKDSVSKQICLEQRKKKYEKLMRPIQPCVIIVGETLHTAKDFYVLFDNVEYKLNSVLAAVDTCFKIIHVMNLVYPSEAYNTLMFIQRYFYKLYLQTEKVPTCVTSLISEL
ncbi:hypothetical protein DMN91_012982 [Ooceraea biroi]|uniref:Uncharacterized protein n=1 Tax=Ooceraea biroi TaxID=2015173 RepID=A0A3L8D3L0_OOCBI|nr:hypothetical protein DMN91_012982 [Ooceraea biroi]